MYVKVRRGVYGIWNIHLLESVGIDNSFHRILISSGLDLDTLLMAADDRLYLNSLLKEAGVMIPGDRVKIFNALREDFGNQKLIEFSG